MIKHKNDLNFYFIFVNTESISVTESQMTDVEKIDDALKTSFVAVYNNGSFACIGYIYSVDSLRVFTYRLCIHDKLLLFDKRKNCKNIHVKSTSDESGVIDVLKTENLLAIFVSICTQNLRF